MAVRERAGLFDETSFNKFQVSGPGALAFLQHLCANDLERPVGSIVYTQALNPRGGIECDWTVTRLAQERFFIVTGTAVGQRDLSWLRLNAPGDGSVSIEDVTSAYACLGLWGPRSRAILQQLTKHDVSNTGLPYMTAQHISVGDAPVLALRLTYVGELGWEFYCPMEYGLRLFDTLWEAGQAEGLAAAGYRAIDTLRLEKGYRYWGAEISPDYTPWEAGLGFAVKLNKGDFIGSQALLAQKERGLTQKLCCLTLDDARVVVLGKEPIRSAGQVVGWVASGGYGYAVGQSIAYGYLPLEHAAAGTRLEIEVFGERVGAVVEQEPLWDPQGKRIKA
jgi:4-methylaminobutanoate oxidase (formaldehyde-forming)